MSVIPGYENSSPGPQIGTKIGHDPSVDEVRLVKQLGLEWMMVNVPHDESGEPVEPYEKIRARFDELGLKIYRLANLSCHNMPEVVLNLPGRDAKVEEYQRYLRATARAGVNYVTYAHMANGIWSGPREGVRGDASARTFRPGAANVGSWVGQEWTDEPAGREYTEDELWANYEYFMRAVAPVAEEAGVYIGMHPDDPPGCTLGGVPRPIFSSLAGYQRAIEIADSPNVGVCLCIGCWLEGGQTMGATPEEAIRAFAADNRLFKVHLRNVTESLPAGFVETFPDDGYGDLRSIVNTLVEVGFDGAVMSDHMPETVGGPMVGEAYAVGYLKGLLEQATAAPGPTRRFREASRHRHGSSN
ncbi:MAG: mannonate dehydratase [Spirochaetota bacterium]